MGVRGDARGFGEKGLMRRGCISVLGELVEEGCRLMLLALPASMERCEAAEGFGCPPREGGLGEAVPDKGAGLHPPEGRGLSPPAPAGVAWFDDANSAPGWVSSMLRGQLCAFMRLLETLLSMASAALRSARLMGLNTPGPPLLPV